MITSNEMYREIDTSRSKVIAFLKERKKDEDYSQIFLKNETITLFYI